MERLSNNLHISLNSFRHASRILKETNSLVKRGLVRHVYIAALHEPGLQECEELDSARTVWRVKLRSKNWSKNFLVQFVKYLEFCWRVSSTAKKNRINLINVHSLDLLPLGVWLKFRLGAKLVYDAHELETEKNGLCGFRKVVSKMIECRLIRFTDLTIVVSWEIEKWYRKKYKMTSIVTVLNCPLYRDTQNMNLLREEFNIPDHHQIILYHGGLLKGRGIELLLDAFERTDDDRYVIIFMGYGELVEKVKNSVARCPHIYYKPAVPPSEVLQYAASADVGVSVIENSCQSYFYCLPNKLFECIMARVPVVVSNLHEMRNVVNNYRIGAVMNYWDADSFFQALHQIERISAVDLHKNLDAAARELSWATQENVMVEAYNRYVLSKGA